VRFRPGDPDALRNVISNYVPSDSGNLANLPRDALNRVVEDSASQESRIA
jgi:hypothetical protein